MSALRAARVGDHAKHDLLPEGRSGAGDESTGSDFAGDGEEDHVVASGRDHRALAIGRCGAGGSATKSTATTDCSTGGRASRRRNGCRWRWWSRCWDCTAIGISISTCGIFTRSCRSEHGIELSYTWVKLALQGAGLVTRGRQRGVHRKRRPRRPLPGMLLHIDGAVIAGFRMNAGMT